MIISTQMKLEMTNLVPCDLAYNTIQECCWVYIGSLTSNNDANYTTAKRVKHSLKICTTWANPFNNARCK